MALLPFRSAPAAYPDRTIKWIVAYAAGCGTDTLARILAETMSSKLEQAIVIDNRPGGATNIGVTAAAKADPDGHTLFTADSGTLVFNPAQFRELPYDPQRVWISCDGGTGYACTACGLPAVGLPLYPPQQAQQAART